jgi:hypothetical protein
MQNSGKNIHMQLDIAVGGFVIFIFGIIFLPESLRTMMKASPSAYGAGYLPLFSSVGLCACGLIVMWESFRPPSKSKGSVDWRKVFRGLGVPTLSLIAYTGTMQWLGFGVSTFLFLVVLPLWFKAYSWPWAVIISGSVGVGFYYIFRVWLFLPLPSGFLF